MLYLSFISLLVLLCNGNLYPCPDGSQGECGRCKGHDDPHIMTFDGVFYDQHTDYCFQYVTECPFGANNPVPFDICACHYDCGSGTPGERGCPNNIMCIGDVSLTFFDVNNGYTPTFEISIDYQNANNPAQDVLNIGALTSGNSYSFDAAGNTFLYIQNVNEHNFAVYGSNPNYYAYISYSPGDLEVYLSEAYFSGSSCGLCGYFDIDGGSNDLTDASGAIMVNPVDLQNYPIDPAVVNQINDFANTYLCDPSTPIGPEPSCVVTPQQEQCFQLAQGCCKQLWNEIFKGGKWLNPIITQDEFFDEWLIGCATDVCAQTNNAITRSCDFTSGAFGFAEQAAVNTAFKEYFSG